MASSSGAFVDHPRLVDNGRSGMAEWHGRSEIWNYFRYIADSEGKPTDTQRPVCKFSFKATQTKGGNTSNMVKHLSDRHLELSKEFK